MKRSAISCLILLVFILGFAGGQSFASDLDDIDFWGITAEELFGTDDPEMQRLFYQSDPLTGTMHPDFDFTNFDLYWDVAFGNAELIFEFDLITPHVTYYGGFYCRELNGLPLGGHERWFSCAPFEETGNQFYVPEGLLDLLVPGKTYAWNVFVLHEDEVIESPMQHFVYSTYGETLGDTREGPNTPIILMQSKDMMVNQSEDATLMVFADISQGELAYQWYSSPKRANAAGTWIANATESYYSAPTDEAGTSYFYCKVTNTRDRSYGEELTTVVSEPIEVEVLPVEKAPEYAYLDFGLKLANGRQNVVLKIPWDDSTFEGLATQHDGNLAVASLALSQAAYSQANVQRSLNALGFEQIKWDYNEDKERKEYVAYAFGNKRCENRGKITNVVAVVLRGTKDWTEWGNNFIRRAKGFAGAEELVWMSLISYLGELEPADELKFLVTGHSRGAAVANILGARLTNSIYGSNQTVFVYSFATPNTIPARERQFYQNVMSWNNKNDPVCFLPAGDKHGVSRWFSLKTDPNMNDYFWRLTGRDLSDYGPIGNISSAHAPETYLSFLLTISPEVTIE